MNNMSPRERILALVVIVTGGAVALFVGFQWFTDSLAQKQALIENAERELADIEATQATFARLSQKRREFAAAALPSTIEVARSEYKAWLAQVAEEAVGVMNPDIQPSTGVKYVNKKTGNTVYETVRCQLEGICTLPQLAHLLDEYYAADYLHRIQSLTVTPVTIQDQQRGRGASSRDYVQITLVSDVVCLPDAVERTDDEGPRSPMRDFDEVLAEYKPLLTRDMFNVPGELPSVRQSGGSRFYTGQPVRISLRGEDDDLMQQLTYQIDPTTVPDRLRERLELEQDFDANEATINLPPLEEGSYEFVVRVSDNGLPAEVVEERVSFRVEERVVERQEEPEEEEEQVDIAEFSWVTAILRDKQGRPLVWIDVKPESEIYKLTEGDEVVIGSVVGIVDRIQGRTVTLLVNGEFYRYQAGDNLLEPEILSAVSFDD